MANIEDLRERFEQFIEEQFAECPNELHYKFVAEGLGIQRDDIPVFKTVQELDLWRMSMQMLRGNESFTKELWDRILPKPSRSSRPEGPTRKPVGADVSSQEARDFYESLTGE